MEPLTVQDAAKIYMRVNYEEKVIRRDINIDDMLIDRIITERPDGAWNIYYEIRPGIYIVDALLPPDRPKDSTLSPEEYEETLLRGSRNSMLELLKTAYTAAVMAGNQMDTEETRKPEADFCDEVLAEIRWLEDGLVESA